MDPFWITVLIFVGIGIAWLAIALLYRRFGGKLSDDPLWVFLAVPAFTLVMIFLLAGTFSAVYQGFAAP